jgi:hypothetical protein
VTDGHPAARATTHWDVGETLADRFRAHAADATHLYGDAIRGMAEDWEAGGPIREVCRGYENAALRSTDSASIAGWPVSPGLDWQAPELMRFYPCLGGTHQRRTPGP